MGLLTSPVCCAVKCCGCIILSQIIGLLLSIGLLVLFIAIFYFYFLPWGKDKIVSELGLPAGTDYDSISDSTIAAHNCSGCVFGTNTDWPTNTTGTLHFLDTSAGKTISGVVATSLLGSAAVGAGTMLWASAFPSMASALSFSGGFYEMTHILEQAQYIGMIGQLQLKGSPEFLTQFSKELAWTNFNLPKSVTKHFLPSRRLDVTGTIADTASAAVQPKYDGETGPAKYAKTLGVDAKDLFFYTLKVFAAVVVVIHLLYVIWIMIASCVSKKMTFGEVAAKWYRKVIWACLLALLLAQYILAMTGSYFIYENVRSDEPKDSNFALGCALLVLAIGFAIIFGIVIIANNTDELKDIGTVEHDDRPFAAKYSAYYDEYNFDNRFFFVPRILLAVGTGVIVGVVQDPTTQLFLVLGVTFLYLLLIIVREPNLLRFLYYIGLTSVFMKVVLLCMMLVLVQDDFFPQNVRDKVAYAIIGINIFIFFLLFLRQAYIIVYKIVRGCKSKGKDDDEDDDDARRNAIQEANRGGRYQRLNSMDDQSTMRNGNDPTNPYTQSQQYKEQSFMGGQQQPYGRGDSSVQAAAAGAAAGYMAKDRYGQQQQPVNPGDVYGQQAGVRGPANQYTYGADPAQGNAAQNRYGNGSEPDYGSQGIGGPAQSGYGANTANAGRNQGRSITDRYLGIDPEASAAAAAGSGAAVGAAAVGRYSQQPNDHAPAEPVVATKAEPEKYKWRRNMERRAAEAAATEEAARQPPPRQGSFVRFDSDDSYETDTRIGDSRDDLNSLDGAAPGAQAGWAVANPGGTANNSRAPQERDVSNGDWFNQRAPSEDGSYASGATFAKSGITTSSLGAGSSNGDDDLASSFMTADSYSSSRQGTVLDSQRSLDMSMDSASRPGLSRDGTQSLDSLAVEYLQKSGDATGATENDIGDEDDEEDEAPAPLLDFPKNDEADDDKDDEESVDIDAAPPSEDEDEEEKEGDRDIDLDEDEDEDIDRESVDIDDNSDSDVDIDSISSHGNDTMLSAISGTSADHDSYSNSQQGNDTMLSAISGTSADRDSYSNSQLGNDTMLSAISVIMSADRDSYSNSQHGNDTMLSTTSGVSEDRDSYSNIKQLDDIRDSYLSNKSGGYERHMSEESLRSDDDASFYLEGRRVDSPSAAERQNESVKSAGPLKL